MKVFRKNEGEIENKCEDLEVSSGAVDREALFSEAVDQLDIPSDKWHTPTHVVTDDNLDPKAVGFVKEGFATGEGRVLQIPGTDVDKDILLKVYEEVVGKPIGHEFRISKHLANPMEICEELKSELEDLIGTEPEVAYIRHSTMQTSFNVKCVEGSEEYFAIIGEPAEYSNITESYIAMIQTCADVFREMTDLRIKTKGLHNLCGESIENYPMLSGSLPYKTRETGRKDGTGNIDYCF